MAINKDSNSYTILFSVVMVVVVGAILSFLSMSLKEPQEKNARDKKQIDILGAVGVEASRQDADTLYNQFIKSDVVIDFEGNVLENPVDKDGKAVTAFDIDIKKDFRDKNQTAEDLNYPAFIAEKDGGKYYIIPMVGKGLWGPIWGFIAIDAKDGNTVYGATFDHKTETPGLGAEIKTAIFEDPFSAAINEEKGLSPKQIFDEKGTFKSIKVLKGGADPRDPHAVSAITGGTITSNGVNEMLKRTLKVYRNYLKANAGQ
jgi:Na+-transporting NADH:ubiquinone oxidoreductase subunit C